jgi:hypothetical protein
VCNVDVFALALNSNFFFEKDALDGGRSHSVLTLHDTVIFISRTQLRTYASLFGLENPTFTYLSRYRSPFIEKLRC